MQIINEANESKVSYRLLNVMLELQKAQERLHRYGTDTPLCGGDSPDQVRQGEPGPHGGSGGGAGRDVGAVSQIAMKLEEKDACQGKGRGSSLRRILRVTPDGERAYWLPRAPSTRISPAWWRASLGRGGGREAFSAGLSGRIDCAEGKFLSCVHR